MCVWHTGIIEDIRPDWPVSSSRSKGRLVLTDHSRLCVTQKQRDDYNSVCLWRTLGTQNHTFSRYVAHFSLWKNDHGADITNRCPNCCSDTSKSKHLVVFCLTIACRSRPAAVKWWENVARTYSFQHKEADQLSKRNAGTHSACIFFQKRSHVQHRSKLIRQTVMRWFSISERNVNWLPVMTVRQWLSVVQKVDKGVAWLAKFLSDTQAGSETPSCIFIIFTSTSRQQWTVISPVQTSTSTKAF